MRTIKPIAFISYNSENHLKDKLTELLENETIDYYIYIKHKKEEEETKDHFHVYIETLNQINTKSLKKFFNEFDINNPEKPLSITLKGDGRSQFNHWIMYVLHVPKYIEDFTNEKKKKYQYTLDDLKTNDIDTLTLNYNAIDYNSLFNKSKMTQAIFKQKNVFDALNDGDINSKEVITYIKLQEKYGDKLRQQGVLTEFENQIRFCENEISEKKQTIEALQNQVELLKTQVENLTKLKQDIDNNKVKFTEIKDNEELPF